MTAARYERHARFRTDSVATATRLAAQLEPCHECGGVKTAELADDGFMHLAGKHSGGCYQSEWEDLW